MASYRAIEATSKAIVGLLKDAWPSDKEEFTQPVFELYHATDNETPVPEGISLMLYQVTVNGTMRNFPPRVTPDGTRYRPSLPLDLHYMMTARASNAENQQRLLGWAMRTLEDTPILPYAVLNNYEAGTFRPEESVELICDSLSIQDLTAIWDKLKQKYQISVAYIARMVAIDSDVKLTDAELAQTRGSDAGRKVR